MLVYKFSSTLIRPFFLLLLCSFVALFSLLGNKSQQYHRLEQRRRNVCFGLGRRNDFHDDRLVWSSFFTLCLSDSNYRTTSVLPMPFDCCFFIFHFLPPNIIGSSLLYFPFKQDIQTNDGIIVKRKRWVLINQRKDVREYATTFNSDDDQWWSKSFDCQRFSFVHSLSVGFHLDIGLYLCDTKRLGNHWSHFIRVNKIYDSILSIEKILRRYQLATVIIFVLIELVFLIGVVSCFRIPSKSMTFQSMLSSLRTIGSSF